MQIATAVLLLYRFRWKVRMIVKLGNPLIPLCSMLAICFAAEAVTGELIDTSSDNLYSTLSLNKLLCSSDLNNRHGYVDCSHNGTFLTPGNCATYDKERGVLSLFSCPDLQPNAAINGYAKLPRNLSQLNDNMCGPLNRKGHLCSECADGFGLSVTSFGYKCVHCTDAWYRVPVFLVLEFTPITVFYLIVLIFQIRIMSAPMPCFIMYAQLMVISLNISSSLFFTFSDGWKLKLDVKIMLILYGLFNLNLSHNNVLPPYCVNSKLKPIHLSIINYMSVFYPILLIFLTWLCVELHGRNFRQLVWLWRPFHRCFVRLRRGWDTKSDIIDVFNTFFLLSYDQLLFQAAMLLNTRTVLRINRFGRSYILYHSILDSKSFHGHTSYFLLIIPAVLVPFIFNFLPPLLLIIYPIKAFQSCLSKCRLNSIALNIFVEKMHGCYRNGLDGGRDMRSFSGLYYFLRMMVYFVTYVSHYIDKHHKFEWYSTGVLLLITTLIMALVQPYKKPFMNYLDVLLLSVLTIQCLTLPLRSRWSYTIVRVLFVIPFVVAVVFVILRRFRNLAKSFSFRRAPLNIESPPSSTLYTPSASESIVQPVSPVLSYGTMK